ncbi:YolD-like family protein [Bacillus norwichensis]|uniref:YolD-like family protein n=1 Tax=Bacillus norwichensis TaxID=2762217 RepID=A0ABR8VFD4_9BACI|nr:YolD-like family protein [Bacillus norwichensis]MBD8003493.1 YolD-like family protein [Bacillus norwichensis]
MRINKLTPGYNLRWESSRMMLPEHREQLLEERRKQQEFIPAILDNDQLQEIDRVIVKSIETRQAITITYATKHGPAHFFGWIQKVEIHEGWLKMALNEETLTIPFKRIINVETN